MSMKSIIDETFLLNNETARRLYFEHAEKLPIIDFHNHLNPQEIYEDRSYANMTEVWLGGDHYKWRAMRAMGYPEELVTGRIIEKSEGMAGRTPEENSEGYAEAGEGLAGNSLDYRRFAAYAATVQNCVGNPLYHWTHLELKRYFDIDDALCPETAETIWNKCNALLQTEAFTTRNLLRKQKVRVLCTTDDPVDDLKWHGLLREEGSDISVRPSFRPGNVLDIEKGTFVSYINRLSEVSGIKITDVDSLLEALRIRLKFFIENGCRVTDHSLETDFFRETTEDEVNDIFTRRMAADRDKEGNSVCNLTVDETAAFKGYILSELGRMYADEGLAMQLHIGAIRNNSERMFRALGADTGFDSINDYNYAPQLAALLNSMDVTDQLPRTILYYLNPKDAAMLMTMAGNFQGNVQGIKGKIQLGSAWWFNDHKSGMQYQLQALADMGVLSTFIGMLTDSRSFLSFPRHEYFRRILCNLVGTLVENGEYPKDMEFLGRIIENICYYNAEEYFRL